MHRTPWKWFRSLYDQTEPICTCVRQNILQHIMTYTNIYKAYFALHCALLIRRYPSEAFVTHGRNAGKVTSNTCSNLAVVEREVHTCVFKCDRFSLWSQITTSNKMLLRVAMVIEVRAVHLRGAQKIFITTGRTQPQIPKSAFNLPLYVPSLTFWIAYICMDNSMKYIATRSSARVTLESK